MDDPSYLVFVTKEEVDENSLGITTTSEEGVHIKEEVPESIQESEFKRDDDNMECSFHEEVHIKEETLHIAPLQSTSSLQSALKNGDINKNSASIPIQAGEKPLACDQFKDDLIHNLITYRHTQEDMVKFKEIGRPLPALFIELQGSIHGKFFKRQFNPEIYQKHGWICGCKRRNALFCFPCLFFGGEGAWTELGITDLIYLNRKIKHHENSKKHLQNQMNFALLGTEKIRDQLDSAYWINITKLNERVGNNRYVLSKIINCIKLSGVLRQQTETYTSGDPSIFQDVINFSPELDKTLLDYLKNTTVFKDGITKDIQNDILDCILEVCRETIAAEIQASPYVAVIIDEQPDKSSKLHLSVIFRYCKYDEPVERFWTYLTPSKHSLESLIQDILNTIDSVLKYNLISQSYAGAAVQHISIQGKVKEKYPFAHFVHCYAHPLNLLIPRIVLINSQVRLFFGNLQAISDFFNNSPQAVEILHRIVRRKTPYVFTQWNFCIKTVNIVFEHKESLGECLEEIEQNFNDITICSSASSIRRMLQDSVFVFWLTFFHHVMPHVNVLSDQLQNSWIEPTGVNSFIAQFEQNMSTIRSSIGDIFKTASDLCVEAPQPKKNRIDQNNTCPRTAAFEVCNVIVDTIKDRFSYEDHLVAASLFYSEQFINYYSKFPDDKLTTTCSAYPTLERHRLKLELSVIYSRTDCRELKGVLPFLKFLLRNKLADIFVETKKLLEILLTTPMLTSEPERCFSTLQRVKAFLRSSANEDHLVALSMLSIEKKLISEIVNFNENVINKFVLMKNRGIDLIYK